MVILVRQAERQEFGMLNGQQEDGDDGILITQRVIRGFMTEHGLNKELGPRHLMNFGFGSVMAGWYALGNQGLAAGGPLGMLLAFLVVSFAYLVVFKVFREFVAKYPFDGGPYAFARQGLGTLGGYAAGISTILQFLAATALVLVLGQKYCSVFYPQVQGNIVASMFIGLLICNLLGVLVSAQIQTILTGTAFCGLILFFLAGSDTMSVHNIVSQQPVRLEWTGLWASLPGAMWTFLGIEGLVMAAEETRRPQQDVPFSLKVCFLFAFGVALVTYLGVLGSIPWSEFARQDFPFPYAINYLRRGDRVLQATFAAINLLVFATGIQALINGYSRQIYALARAGYLPALFGYVGRPRQTPAPAIVIPGIISLMISLFTDERILSFVTLFSAITMYCLVIVAFIRLKNVHRPSSVVCLLLFAIVQGRVVYQFVDVSWVIPCVWAVAGAYYFLVARHRIVPDAPEENAAAIRREFPRVELK